MIEGNRRLVLTYHSISDGGGPTSIPEDVFAMQVAGLARAGYTSCTIDEYQAWRSAPDAGSAPRVLITFDDAFLDFRMLAAPILERAGFTAVVFVPTARIGSPEQWDGANSPARPLMDWNDIKTLAAAGFEFGAHSCTHAKLPTLDPAARETEVKQSGIDLSARLGTPVCAFAAPYGAVDRQTITLISQHYSIAFGTRLAISRRDDDQFDIPRLDMHYFRSERAWSSLLAGNLAYLDVRRALRAARHIALNRL